MNECVTTMEVERIEHTAADVATGVVVSVDEGGDLAKNWTGETKSQV